MIRKFPEQTERVETGPIQFGEDWPGIFIRGDNAFGFCMALEDLFENPESPFSKLQVRAYIRLLDECNINPATKVNT